MAISEEMLEEKISWLKLCKWTWIVQDIKLLPESESCLKKFEILVQNDINYYNFKWNYIVDECMVDSIYKTFYQNIPKKWDTVSFISDEKYKIIDINSNFDFKWKKVNDCKSNYTLSQNINKSYDNQSFWSMEKNYIFLGIIVFFLIIIAFWIRKMYFAQK